MDFESIKTDKQAQAQFQWNLTLKDVKVADCGDWEELKLSRIPIAPATVSDAQSWSEALFVRQLEENTQPLDREAVKREFAALCQETPLASLPSRRPSLPSHKDLLQLVEHDAASFWRLAAPVDLALQPPSDAELAAWPLELIHQ